MGNRADAVLCSPRFVEVSSIDETLFSIFHLFPYWELNIFAVVRVIAKSSLRDFWITHPDCEIPLRCWYKDAVENTWLSPNDIKRDFPSASFLHGNRVVFNIKGNRYRLIVKINFDYSIVWIRFIGTHAEYSRIDALNI